MPRSVLSDLPLAPHTPLAKHHLHLKDRALTLTQTGSFWQLTETQLTETLSADVAHTELLQPWELHVRLAELPPLAGLIENLADDAVAPSGEVHYHERENQRWLSALMSIALRLQLGRSDCLPDRRRAEAAVTLMNLHHAEKPAGTSEHSEVQAPYARAAALLLNGRSCPELRPLTPDEQDGLLNLQRWIALRQADENNQASKNSQSSGFDQIMAESGAAGSAGRAASVHIAARASTVASAQKNTHPRCRATACP